MTEKQSSNIEWIKRAHDALSDVLEDEDAGNDDVRQAAIEICLALNAAGGVGIFGPDYTERDEPETEQPK